MRMKPKMKNQDKIKIVILFNKLIKEGRYENFKGHRGF